MNNIKDIKSLNLEELCNYLTNINQKRFRADQIFEWLYKYNTYSFKDMTNIGRKLQTILSSYFYISKPKLVDKQISNDNSIKFLIEYNLNSTKYYVECVAINSSSNKITACISSQVGCPLGCVFCSTGKQGFIKNLSFGNIIDQLLLIQKEIGKKISNVVFMGQGEPFINFNNVISAANLINNKKFFNIGSRKITISTSGIIPGIEKLSNINKQYILAVSLHSANQKTRDLLMPGVKKYNLIHLKNALKEYQSKTNRRITFEYVMINNINDTKNDLNELIDYCQGIDCHINLIPLNNINSDSYYSSDNKTISIWKNTLKSNFIEATIRNSKGDDIAAACGQLSSRHK